MRTTIRFQRTLHLARTPCQVRAKGRRKGNDPHHKHNHNHHHSHIKLTSHPPQKQEQKQKKAQIYIPKPNRLSTKTPRSTLHAHAHAHRAQRLKRCPDSPAYQTQSTRPRATRLRKQQKTNCMGILKQARYSLSSTTAKKRK